MGRLPRGVPPGQQRRAIMDQGDAWLERRCRTQTALAKGATRRRRLLRFPPGGEPLTQRLAPPLAKALTLLDAQLLPAPSHAVERGKRR